MRIAAEDGSSSCEWNALGSADFGGEVVNVLRDVCCGLATGVNVRTGRVGVHLGASTDLVRKLRRTNREEEAII